MKRIIGFLTTMCMSFASLATAAVAAQFDPSEGLVGVPASVIVTVENGTSEPFLLPRRFAIVANAPDGSSFRLRDLFGTDVGTVPGVYADDELRVPIAETRQFYVPLGRSLVEPGFFGDRRLYSVGNWRLTFLFDDRLNPGGGLIEDPAVTVANVKYAVVNGDAIDQRVWTALLARTNGAGLGHVDPTVQARVAADLLREIPQSRYRADLLIARGAHSHEAAVEMAETVLKLEPRAYLNDLMLLLIADVLETNAVSRSAGEDSAEAQEAFQRAAAAFADVSRLSRTDVGRRMGERKREKTAAHMKERFPDVE